MVGPVTLPPAESNVRPPSLQTVRDWLAAVADPEIPVISVLDLGIVRNIDWQDEELVVTVTPTYSGCPATVVIRQDIETALRAHGLPRVRVEMQLSPAWTTDWISAEGRMRLREYGIAPPSTSATPALQAVDLSRLHRRAPPAASIVPCPQCASERTALLSAFSSTPCKALYRCLDCLDPFDYFKPH